MLNLGFSESAAATAHKHFFSRAVRECKCLASGMYKVKWKEIQRILPLQIALRSYRSIGDGCPSSTRDEQR